MANRPKGYGMTAELAKKKAAKFDADLANEAVTWICNVLDDVPGVDIDALQDKEIAHEKDVHVPLKDGVILCELVNRIKPGSVKKINKNSTAAFKQMENIGNFLLACESLGCKKADLFQTVDLFEANNIPQVVNGIFALGRKGNAVEGLPRLGPEEATENKRLFTEKQLRAGEGVIGLQAGSNKGASQAGQNFGKTRAIID